MSERKPHVGDWADHKSGELDERPVAAVSDDGTAVLLQIGKTVTPWLPAENYDFTPGDDWNAEVPMEPKTEAEPEAEAEPTLSDQQKVVYDLMVQGARKGMVAFREGCEEMRDDPTTNPIERVMLTYTIQQIIIFVSAFEDAEAQS